MQGHPWIWIITLFVLPLLAALVVNLLVRHRGISSNAVLAWFVIVCWVGAIGVILSQVT